MRIDRVLLVGIIGFAITIVVITAGFLTRDMLQLSHMSLDALHDVSMNVDLRNTEIRDGLTKQATEVSENVWTITDQAATEQLRAMGNGIAAEVKAVMDTPFAAVKSLANFLLFEKTDAEKNGQIPSRSRVEKFLVDYLKNNSNIRGIFSGWEKNQFDGKDADFIGKENPDPDMEHAFPDYVSEGAFLPWFY
ncbi:MAG: hypothetical protein ACRCUY_02415, partial [Thermoguttaceae bacterium]